MDYKWYVDECLRQLNDNKYYQKQTKDLTDKIQQRIKEYTSRMYNDKLIDEKTYKYLTSNPNPRAGRFYILPKIHKQGNPGRPIISSNGHPSERISEFVDYHLKPLVQTLPSYIKDTTHFLFQLQNLGPLPENAILVTLDVSSLYTNIPHKEGEEACRHFLNTRPLKSIPTERICDLIRMILGMNNFSFNGQHFLQTHGTAMARAWLLPMQICSWEISNSLPSKTPVWNHLSGGDTSMTFSWSGLKEKIILKPLLTT